MDYLSPIAACSSSWRKQQQLKLATCTSSQPSNRLLAPVRHIGIYTIALLVSSMSAAACWVLQGRSGYFGSGLGSFSWQTGLGVCEALRSSLTCVGQSINSSARRTVSGRCPCLGCLFGRQLEWACRIYCCTAVAAKACTLDLAVCAILSVGLITVGPPWPPSPVWLFGFNALVASVGFTLLWWWMMWV